MKTYSVFMQRVQPNAGQLGNIKITVQAATAEMARLTAEAQYPGYRCFNSPTRVF